jgi:hypothetical protein
VGRKDERGWRLTCWPKASCRVEGDPTGELGREKAEFRPVKKRTKEGAHPGNRAVTPSRSQTRPSGQNLNAEMEKWRREVDEVNEGEGKGRNSASTGGKRMVEPGTTSFILVSQSRLTETLLTSRPAASDVNNFEFEAMEKRDCDDGGNKGENDDEVKTAGRTTGQVYIHQRSSSSPCGSPYHSHESRPERRRQESARASLHPDLRDEPTFQSPSLSCRTTATASPEDFHWLSVSSMNAFACELRTVASEGEEMKETGGEGRGAPKGI